MNELTPINLSGRSPIPKTTPTVTVQVERVTITFRDGRIKTIEVEEECGFYRESVMKSGDRKVRIQEVFITDGQVA